MIETPHALAALIAAVTALAFWVDRRFAWGAKVGATLWVIVFGAVLSNLGLVPVSSPVYDGIMGPVTSLAIVWLLFAVDVRDLKDAGPRMVAAFGIAVTATALGAITAALVFGGAIGDESWKLAGVMTGTYAGGGLNFVAVGRELQLSPDLFSAATAADNVMTALWFGATMVLPLWLRRYYPAPPVAVAASRAEEEQSRADEEQARAEQAQTDVGAAGDGRAGRRHDHGGREHDPDGADGEPAGPSSAPAPTHRHPFLSTTKLRVIDVTVLLALGLGLIGAADAVAGAVPGVPAILWLTTFALVVGHSPWVRRLHGAMHLGSLGLHLFFAVLGILSRISEILRVGPEVFWFTALVVLVHGVVTYGGCRIARLDVETTSVASQAAVGGPSSALALAVGRDWHRLILPGVVVGLLGYAVGNYLGVGIAYWLR